MVWRTLVAIFCMAVVVSAQDSFQFHRVADDDVWSRLEHSQGKTADREQELKALFAEAGCAAERLTELPVSHSKTPDLICILPGETDRQIIVGAHYDKVDVGDGVVDNWSGASMLPSLLQALSTTPRRHTYLFIGFTDEEKGLVGSAAYVKQIPKEQREKISGMVNLDTLGLGPAEVWASHADPTLLKALITVAATMKLPLTGMNVDNVGSSDSESFRNRKIPALTVHSVTADNFPILHSSRDTLKQIQRKDYLDTFRLISGYLAYLDVVLDKGSQTSGSNDAGKPGARP